MKTSIRTIEFNYLLPGIFVLNGVRLNANDLNSFLEFNDCPLLESESGFEQYFEALAIIQTIPEDQFDLSVELFRHKGSKSFILDWLVEEAQ